MILAKYFSPCHTPLSFGEGKNRQSLLGLRKTNTNKVSHNDYQPDLTNRQPTRLGGQATGNWQLFTMLLVILSSCANEAAPKGGKQDTTSPKVIYAKPAPNSLHFNTQDITIKFSEYILNPVNPQEVLISPPMEKAPSLIVEGKKLKIRLKSPLKPNTTYTINFGNGIKDNNEGNPIANFRYVFSTGDMLDSATISGQINNTAKPAEVEGLLVELYPIDSPKAITRSKPYYFSRTDKAGNYKIENIKADKYWAYILKDENLNYIYDQPTELIGYMDTLLLINDSSKINNVNGKVFNSEKTKPKIGEAIATYPGKIILPFNAPVKELRLSSNIETKSDLLTQNATKDTFIYWYSNIKAKEIKMTISADDTVSDSLRINLKAINPDSIPDRKKYALYIENQIVKADTNTKNGQNNALSNPFKPLRLELSRPVTSTDRFKGLQITNDSTHHTDTVAYTIDSVSHKSLAIKFVPQGASSYTVTIPDSALIDNWGWYNKKLSHKWQTDSKEKYGNIIFSLKIENPSKYYILEVLDAESKIVQTFYYRGIKDKRVTIPNLPAGNYTLKAIDDTNHNGEWDTGNFEQRRQPERIINFKESHELKAGWDLEIEVKL
jgi:Bacterial Ig-like domain